jgi:hypothetical protein
MPSVRISFYNLVCPVPLTGLRFGFSFSVSVCSCISLSTYVQESRIGGEGTPENQILPRKGMVFEYSEFSFIFETEFEYESGGKETRFGHRVLLWVALHIF